MIWQSFAPKNLTIEWKWNDKAKKWVRTTTTAVYNAYSNYAQIAFQYGDNSKKAKKAQAQLQNLIASTKRENQEANAWIHDNYGNAHYYTTDTMKSQTYEQYLQSLSDDQLRQSQSFWKNQLSHLDKHNSKHKQDWFNNGDADRAHYDQNYGPHNPIYDSLHTHIAELPNRDKPDMAVIDQYAKQYNDNLYNSQRLRALIAESTSHRGNYWNLVKQYNKAKANTKASQQSMQNMTRSIHGLAGYVLNNFFKYNGNSLRSQYYLDNSYTNHDNWRLAQIENYMKIRHQDEINASIRAQIVNNWNHSLVSIYRKDKKDDIVIGIAENSPNESLDMNISTSPIDEGMPQTNFAQLNSKQFTENGTVYNRPLEFAPGIDDSNAKQMTRRQEYDTLMDWETDSVPVCIVGGLSWWHSALIQSLTKAPEPTATENGLNIQFTLQYLRLAKIKWGKKAAGGKSKGRNTRTNKSTLYKVRPGNTIYGIAHGNMTQVHAIEKANPKLSNPNLIYPNQRLVIPK